MEDDRLEEIIGDLEKAYIGMDPAKGKDRTVLILVTPSMKNQSIYDKLLAEVSKSDQFIVRIMSEEDVKKINEPFERMLEEVPDLLEIMKGMNSKNVVRVRHNDPHEPPIVRKPNPYWSKDWRRPGRGHRK